MTYEWRRHEFPSHNFSTGSYTGFLADEVQELLPHLVGIDGEGWKSMDYAGIIPYLVRAMQEQQREVQEQQKQIDALLAALQRLT